MNADSLLTKEERKTIIERLVELAKNSGLKEHEIKQARKLYSSWSDAKLMSVKFK